MRLSYQKSRATPRQVRPKSLAQQGRPGGPVSTPEQFNRNRGYS
jgi:hypothetical protein